MSKIDIILVFNPVEYFNTILIPYTNKVLKYPLDLCEFIRWVGCWLYSVYWVGIP